jgi:hypothetical protein
LPISETRPDSESSNGQNELLSRTLIIQNNFPDSTGKITPKPNNKTMTKETIEEVKTKLAALKLPDVTVNELVTIVTEPLAHLEVKSADGGRLQIWTPAAVFTVDLAACRIGVAGCMRRAASWRRR